MTAARPEILMVAPMPPAVRLEAGYTLHCLCEADVPDRLRALPEVVLSPHRASANWKTRAAVGDLVLTNIDA